MRLPIYLDNHATTRLDPRVLQAMLPFLTGDFGNAASVSHVFGWKAEAAVTASREILADALGGSEREIVFTSGATESNNLAILGAARALRGKGDHVVTTEVELEQHLLSTVYHSLRHKLLDRPRFPRAPAISLKLCSSKRETV